MKGRLVMTIVTSLILTVSFGCALRRDSMGAPVAGVSKPSVPGSQTDPTEVRGLASPSRKSGGPANLEQQDRALSSALQLLALTPTGQGHRAVGQRYRVLGVPDMAYRHLNRAVEINHRDSAAHDGLARLWRDWGFADVALPHAYRSVFYAPASAPAYNTLGTVFQALGLLDEAREAYLRATELDQRAVYALSNLCYLSFLQGKFDESGIACRSALGIDPAYAPAHNNLALANAATGRFDLARIGFIEAADTAVGLFNMGIVHMAERDYGNAAAAFEAASRANPALKLAHERASQARQLGRTSARRGDQR